jgi:hypothetical protein|uniref:Uncharacterized protein n=1 Tax=Halalkalibacterium halodurans TaxID=86665 RepID=A0A0M0KIS8_ALKHA
MVSALFFHSKEMVLLLKGINGETLYKAQIIKVLKSDHHSFHSVVAMDLSGRLYRVMNEHRRERELNMKTSALIVCHFRRLENKTKIYKNTVEFIFIQFYNQKQR